MHVGLNYEAMEMLERALVAGERNKSLGKDAMITIEIAFETAKMYRKTGKFSFSLFYLPYHICKLSVFNVNDVPMLSRR